VSFPLVHGSLDGYEREELGYRERFSTPTLGGGRTVAVHTEPLGREAPVTWVLLHSFGPEHDNLAAFDASLCRGLASSGHAAIRFHGQGHGDSELGPDALGVEAQVAGALDAVALARDGGSPEAVGLIGVRFGGAIATLAAARTEVGSLVLIEPVTNGRAFLRSLVRLDRSTEVSLGAKADVRKEDPFEVARVEGVLEIEGIGVPWPTVIEFESVDLLRADVPSGVPALVLQISRSDAPREDLVRLAERLGPRAVHDVVVDDNALRFGLPPWRISGERQKVDSLASVTRAVVGLTVRWCVGEVAGRD
jgi:pimeloyl-ACP methyl ester carboxylesterase